MTYKLLHTPEGVRDIYHEECMKKHKIESQIQQVFHLFGYEEIETPTFEFFDVFNKERGSVKPDEMFKFFDRDNQTLVLRPDMTPSIARYVSRYFNEETHPLRLSYLERTFLNADHYQGRLKEITQTGVELIGEDSAEADAEMIAMVIESLKAVGLEEFQVELGQVDFFRGLAQEAGMDQKTQESLRELIENKNHFGIEALITAFPMADQLKQTFLKLPELFGDLEQIRQAKTLTTNQRAVDAITRLEQIYEILTYYDLADYVSFDLGMLSKYEYYTGVIFKAYTYGSGDYIVAGGRYDKLLIQFGKDTPAVGFAIAIDQLMTALNRQNIQLPLDFVNTMILYDQSARQRAIVLATYFRLHQTPAQLMKKADQESVEAYQTFAKKHHLKNILYLSDTGEQITFVAVDGQNTHQIAFEEYIKED